MKTEYFKCDECEQVTPHEIHEHVDFIEWYCQVCGHNDGHHIDDFSASNDD